MRETYAHILGKKKEGINLGWTIVMNKKKRTIRDKSTNQGCTIFVTKIPDTASTMEIWDYFKQKGKILDIVLPKKRDKCNNRIGFVKTESELEAGVIISNLEQLKGLGRILRMFDKWIKEYKRSRVEEPKGGIQWYFGL